MSNEYQILTSKSSTCLFPFPFHCISKKKKEEEEPRIRLHVFDADRAFHRKETNRDELKGLVNVF